MRTYVTSEAQTLATLLKTYELTRHSRSAGEHARLVRPPALVHRIYHPRGRARAAASRRYAVAEQYGGAQGGGIPMLSKGDSLEEVKRFWRGPAYSRNPLYEMLYGLATSSGGAEF